MSTTRPSGEDARANPEQTLGKVLYADPKLGAAAPEADWVRLVGAIARGDRAALRELYERTGRPVFTLFMRITSSREIAQDLTVALYRGLPRQAKRFRGDTTVVAWIMARARDAATARLRRDQRANRKEPSSRDPLIAIDMPDYRNLMRLRDEGLRLREALDGLGADERKAIETVYFGALEREEAAVRLDCSLAGLDARLKGALDKLEQSLLTGRAGPTPACAEGGALTYALVLQALPADVHAAASRHLSSCAACRKKAEALETVVGFFAVWPTDLLRPGPAVARRLAEYMGERSPAWAAAASPWNEWQQVAPPIWCQMLSEDRQSGLVSLLVRLVPGGEYPPHVHAGTEELFLLDGQLWIEDRKLFPGDYNRAEAGTRDLRVWSQTGCMCVLVTSARDILT